MKKRLWLFSAIFILIVLATILVLNVRKLNGSLAMKKRASVSLHSLTAQVKAFETGGDLSSAQSLYQRLINEFPNSSEVLNWQKKVEAINVKLLFSPAVTGKSLLYEIKSGDTLNKIAKEFKTTIDLIKKSNNLASNNILPGRKIKVWTAPFNILVDKSQNTLILKTDEEIFKTYLVSTGANNSTPTGNFKIVNRLPNPTWYKAGAVVPAGSPENILGSRWLGLNLPGYGIHGTTEPQSLGRQVTQGCVRMSNSDVEELYSIVPEGTEVTIVD